MELTPKKSISLKSNPKGKFNPDVSELTPKKVRFSITENSLKNSNKGKLYKAEDVFSMLNDSSLSEGETSTDEEWIVTKSKALTISDSPELTEESTHLANESTAPLKKALVKVTPLKLLRKTEYEVNKVSNTNKKNVTSVSPIVLKRKTDTKVTPDATFLPLTPSTKLNASEPNSVGDSSPSVRRSQRQKKPVTRHDSDTENEYSPPKRKTPSKKNRNLDKSYSTPRTKRKIHNQQNDDEARSSDSDHSKPLAHRLKLSAKTSHILPDTFPSPSTLGKKSLTPKTSTHKKLESPSIQAKTLSDDFPVPPDLDSKPRTPRTSARKKLELSSPILEVVTDPAAGSPNLRSRTCTPRTSVRKKLELPSPKLIEEHSQDDSSSDQSEELKTPKKRSRVLFNAVVDSPSLRRQVLTPKHSAQKKLLSSPGRMKKIRSGFLSPVVQERTKRNLLGTPTTRLDLTRASLHTSNVPTSLPCREKEFNNVLTFTMRKIEDRAGGCMYISGVPGTGKTATVHAVIKLLQEKAENEELSDFDFVEINGLRLTEPRQAYTRIWLELSGNKCSPEVAMIELEKKFSKKCKCSTVILIDELDYLCNRRQDVIYNILEWSTKSSAALTVITIANTMDLPERTLKGKVTSRMGLTRLVFQPYTFQQLQQIVLNRIGSNSNFHVDAIQLVARKVAAVSGDARRALDICRRATELISSETEVVKVSHIEKALNQIFSGTRVKAIKNCSIMSQFLLRAMRDEFHRTGVEETTVGLVYSQFSTIATLEGYEVPAVSLLLNMSSALADSGLILAERYRSDLNRKLSLNVSPDDIHYALSC